LISRTLATTRRLHCLQRSSGPRQNQEARATPGAVLARAK
jgi:hypothetical protein